MAGEQVSQGQFAQSWSQHISKYHLQETVTGMGYCLHLLRSAKGYLFSHNETKCWTKLDHGLIEENYSYMLRSDLTFSIFYKAKLLFLAILSNFGSKSKGMHIRSTNILSTSSELWLNMKWNLVLWWMAQYKHLSRVVTSKRIKSMAHSLTIAHCYDHITLILQAMYEFYQQFSNCNSKYY